MPRDSGGTYTLPAGNPVTTATAISSTWANNTLNDIVTALTGSLSRSGDGSMLAPLELDSGTLGAPGLCFGAETGLGLYRASASVLGVAIGGVKVAQFDSTGLVVPLAASVTGVLSALASIELGHASDTTLSRIAAGRIAVEGNELARLAGAPVFTGTSFTVASTAPEFRIQETDGAANEQYWIWLYSSGRLSLRGYDDALNASNPAIVIERTGNTVDSVQLLGAALTLTGNTAIAGTASVSSTLSAATTIELGHATDTTLARIAAGRVSVEGIELGFRQIRRSATVSGTLTAAESGYCVPATGGVTINPSVFATGDAVTIYNDSGASITITQGVSMTLRHSGTANTGNRTLAQRGLATIWFDEHNDAVIAGTGLT